MNSSFYRFLYGAGVLLAMFLTWAQVAAAAQSINTRDMPILRDWQGDFPVTELGLLPEGQRELSIGYLNNRKVFTEVWQVFKPEEEIPEIDFGNDLVLFVRNVNFYNRVSIAKVVLRETTAEVLIRSTMSALPIEDKVAMALAVIPRNGIEFLQSSHGPIAVSAEMSMPAANPLDITLEIAGQKIVLHNGHSEIPLSTDGVSKIRTSVFNDPVTADLDSDGDDDAVLLLVHDPGGSGTFYYLVAALNSNGSYQGTNTVLLGDRIIPQSITVQNGIITATYKTQKQGEARSAVPSFVVKRYLTVKSGELTALNPLSSDE